jgi:hypothetical protein
MARISVCKILKFEFLGRACKLLKYYYKGHNKYLVVWHDVMPVLRVGVLKPVGLKMPLIPYTQKEMIEILGESVLQAPGLAVKLQLDGRTRYLNVALYSLLPLSVTLYLYSVADKPKKPTLLKQRIETIRGLSKVSFKLEGFAGEYNAFIYAQPRTRTMFDSATLLRLFEPRLLWLRLA